MSARQLYARAGEGCVELYDVAAGKPVVLTWEQALYLGSRLISEGMALKERVGWEPSRISDSR